MKKLLLLVLFVIFANGIEVVWNSGDGVSDSEFERMKKEYIEKNYASEVKEWEKQQYILLVDNLMWQDNKVALTNKMTWNEAVKYCQNLQLAGFTDWRLPTLKELKELFKYKSKLKYITSDYYWSSITDNSDSKYAGIVYFYNGRDALHDKSSSYYIRCIREQ